METKPIERYFFFGLLLTTIIFVTMIFKPFLVVLILSISFAVTLNPIYKWIHKKIKSEWLSSFLVVVLFFFMLCIPLFIIGAIIFTQAQDLFITVVQQKSSYTFINSIENTINNILPEGIIFDANQKIYDFVFFISNNIAKIFSTTLSAIFGIVLILLSIFYFLRDGKKWKDELIKLSPLRDKDDEKILNKLEKAIKGVVTGHLLIALIQGTLMGFGLWIFDVPNPALWGVVAGIGSLIPMVGTGIVSIPIILFLIFTGNITGAIGISVWSLILVGTIDDILKPYLIGDKVNIHPMLILFSVLGGIALLGPVGVLVGPLSVSLLYSLVSIYKNEFE